MRLTKYVFHGRWDTIGETETLLVGATAQIEGAFGVRLTGCF